MSWQDKYRERYEERLRDRWTPDGERIPPNLIGSDGQYTSQLAQYERTVGYKPLMTHHEIPWNKSDTVYDIANKIMRNTREICGND